MKTIKIVALAAWMVAIFCLCATAQQSESCKCSETPIADPFAVHGRLSLDTGEPSVRIWIIGTKRILGVREADLRNMPETLFKMLKGDTYIYGDFTVCPLTVSRPGQMQIVCIESATNLVAKKRE